MNYYFRRLVQQKSNIGINTFGAAPKQTNPCKKLRTHDWDKKKHEGSVDSNG